MMWCLNHNSHLDALKGNANMLRLVTRKNEKHLSTWALELLHFPESTLCMNFLLCEITHFGFFKDLIYLFFLEREKGREKEREGKISAWLPLVRPLLGTWPATQSCALTENQTGYHFVSQPSAQSAELHQPGLHFLIFKKFIVGFSVTWNQKWFTMIIWNRKSLLGETLASGIL